MTGFVKRPSCPFCSEPRLGVYTEIEANHWEMGGASGVEVHAQVSIRCDACHKTIYERAHHE